MTHKVRSPLGKTVEVVVLVLVFVLVLTFSDVSRMARDSPHLSKVGIAPEHVDAFDQKVRDLVPAALRPAPAPAPALVPGS